MPNTKISYNSQTYNAGKSFLYAFPIYILLIAIVIGLGVLLCNPIIGVIGWIIVSSVPFLFQKRFKRIFTKKLVLEFDDQVFSTKEYTLTSDVLVSETTICWSDMKSYKCYFSASDITFLVIYLRNGSTKSFSFKDEKNQEQAMNEKSVFSIFYYYVKQYNSDKQPEEVIALKPGFLTTRSGAFVLYSLAILAVVGIVIHFVLAPKTFMLSFMSFFIIMGLVIKRKTDKDLYGKINQLEPRTPIN